MKSRLTKISTMLLIFTLLFTFIPNTMVFADADTREDLNIVHEYIPTGDPDAKVIFVDDKLVDNNGITPKGITHEVYSHSYYTVQSKQITGYNVGPINNQRHLISVAKGQTETLSSAIQVTGSVEFSASGSLPGPLKQIININLTGKVTGSVSHTYNTTTFYSGPPESSIYNTRDYYAAVDYDAYSFVVNRYDVYDVYLDNQWYTVTEYFAGTQNVNSVKSPKHIAYSLDFIN